MKLPWFFLLFLGSFALVSSGSSNSIDELVLLSFKSMLASGLSSLLDSWNDSSHFCSWPGVVCGRRHPERVVALQMSSFNLSGVISPFLGNLSFLRRLDLHDNQLVGTVPLELGLLGRLQVLNLSINHIQGSIPVTLGGCAKLEMLDLSSNQLQGEIPYEIGTLNNLVRLNLGKNCLSGVIPLSLAGLRSIKYLYLFNNRLSGEVPPCLGNLTNLHRLHLENNMLSGLIPSSLGMLSSLSALDLGFNNLSGLIPTSIWNISVLTWFSIERNMLSGIIPPTAFNNVPHLRNLLINNNQFHGPIPASVSNASEMTIFQLDMNFFSGIVPAEVGRLRNLKSLQLNGNLLQAKVPKEWEFLTALANCSELQVLALATNKFEGALIDSISNLSTSLTSLALYGNKISGSISKDIGNLINMQVLLLHNNSFGGYLPSSLCRLKNLVIFYVAENNIMGSIPDSIRNLTNLSYLRLDENALSGTIPSTLGDLVNLIELRVSGNYLTGPIPSKIFTIPTLSGILDLSDNSLEGSLPQEIGGLKSLVEFYAESNKLSGEIPNTIGECQLLRYLLLQNNSLNGSIPSTMSKLRGLDGLDLSSNKLSGQIPKFLGNLTMIYYLNLSFNNFSGQVPNFGVFTNNTAISVQGNGELCGGIPDLHLPTCSSNLPKRKHKFLVISIVSSLVVTLAILPMLYKLIIWKTKRKVRIPSTHSMQGHPLISYSQLVTATGGFSENNLLGSGSFGSVYKGELNDQEGQGTTHVAVKVLKLQNPKALKSFTAECEALRNLRHRNLVKIVTICSSIDNRGSDFKAIVYGFMSNGSLEAWLHQSRNSQAVRRCLNILERLTILLDVAYALDYLHCHGPEPVVHCDLKSSNVLLDADMVAHVGDFGLAKILVQGCSWLQQSTSSMGFRGTIGYAAPEYGAGNMVSTHGDVYSYGILVLETVTGRRPTENTFGQGLSLREYTRLALQNRAMDAVDTRLSLDLENELHTRGDYSWYKRQVDCIVSLLELCLALRNCRRAGCQQEVSSKSCLPSRTLSSENTEREDGQ